MKHATDPHPRMAERGGDVRVGVYVRRSTDDEHQPWSIEAQDARLAAYIGLQPGWRQAARFTDDASGAPTGCTRQSSKIASLPTHSESWLLAVKTTPSARRMARTTCSPG